jgi:hypothetical protein
MPNFTAFHGSSQIAAGELIDVVTRAKNEFDCGNGSKLLIFKNETGEQFDVDLGGTLADVQRRLLPPSEEARGPGRPKLGVVAREVTLLPRHWDWLSTQPGGASVALRRLVDDAKRTHQERDGIRQAREAAYRFMSAVAGNEPGFEEASRALFSGNQENFEELARLWPPDVRDYAVRLAAPSFDSPETPPGSPATMMLSPHNS